MATPSTLHAMGLEKPLIPVFPFPLYMDRAPTSSDKNFNIGQIWFYKIDPDTCELYAFAGLDSTQSAIWLTGSVGPAVLSSLEAEAGDTSVSGSSGTILLAGTANQIVTTGDNTAHSITFSLDPDVVITTSLDVPLIVPTGGDLSVQLGDNIGANYLAVENALGSRKIILDSAGVITAPQMQTTTDLTLKLSDGAGASSLYVVDDTDVQKFKVISDGQVEVSNRIVAASGNLEVAGADVITTLGDSGGVNKLSIQTVASVEVASIGSDGRITGSLYSFTSTYGMSGQVTLVAGTATVVNANIATIS